MIADLIGIGTLSQALNSEPALISQIVRIAIRSRQAERTMDLLLSLPFSYEEISVLQGSFSARDTRHLLRRGLIGERQFGLSFAEDPHELNGWSRALRPFGGLVLPAIMVQNKLIHLTHFDRLMRQPTFVPRSHCPRQLMPGSRLV